MTQQTKEPVSAKESIRQTRIQKLAELAGVHRTYIGMIERAEKNITLMHLIRMLMQKICRKSIRIFLPEKKQKIFILLQAELWQYVTLECLLT